MARTELETHSKRFALTVIELVGHIPPGKAGDIIGRQVLRSATSVGANYREANRAESRADFVHKIEVATKEPSETVYWLEIINESPRLQTKGATEALKEAQELLAIFATIGKNAKKPR
jgi:four helix bundle protein